MVNPLISVIAIPVRALAQRRLASDLDTARRIEKAEATLSEDRRLERQLAAIGHVWDDAVADVPYYRDLVDRGRAPRQIETWDDFRDIPILDRGDMQSNAGAFVRISRRADLLLQTGGSTGEPVRLGEWRNTGQLLRAAKLIPWIRAGYDPSASVVLVWGHAHLLGSGWRRHVNRLKRAVKDCALRYSRFDAYHISRSQARRIAMSIVQSRPAGVIGYASALDLICRHTPDLAPDLRSAGVRFVMPCAEPLPRDDSRDLLESTFEAPVLQEFGGVDFGHVGYQFARERFRVLSTLNTLELETGKSEDSGNALVTTLYRRYVPLLRYRQGDQIAGCRRDSEGLVTQFSALIGRTNDMVEVASGQWVHSVAFIHALKPVTAILNAQLALTSSGIALRFVASRELTPGERGRVTASLRRIHVPTECLQLERVEDLATSLAGKRRWVVDERG